MKDKLCHIKRIDNLGRIVIPKAICNIAQITEDDALNIVWDEHQKVICMYKCNEENFIDNIFNNFLKTIYELFDSQIVITDKNKVIRVLCKDNYRDLQDLLNKNISKDLINMIFDDLRQYQELDNISITSDFELKKHCYYFLVSENNYRIGSVLIITKDNISKDLLNYLKKQLIK